MNSFNDRLYSLIPAIYRIRDEESDGPLRAMLSVISQQVEVIERDMEQLYDNWFIETCAEWAVPYIGELVGHQPVVPTTGEITDPRIQARNRWLFPRREIANIVKYRRRKGTLAVLEEIALDTAGWYTRAVEYRKQIVATPNLRFSDPDSVPQLPNFRDPELSDRWGGAFNKVGHTVNVRAQLLAEARKSWRNPASSEQQIGLPIAPKSIGLWVWRKPVYSITGVTPGCRVHRDVRYFTFHPLGLDVPLYNQPQRSDNPEELANENELPVALTRTRLGDGREQRPNQAYYAAGRSLVIRIKASFATQVGVTDSSAKGFVEIPADRIRVTDLSDHRLTEVKDAWPDAAADVLLDPELGRFVLKAFRKAPQCALDLSPRDLQVTYHAAFGGDLGGGEYYRPLDPQRKLATWIVTPEKMPVQTDSRCPAVAVPKEDSKDKPLTPIDRAFYLLQRRLEQLQPPSSMRLPADQRHLVLELAETGVYSLSNPLILAIPRNVTVEVRASARVCPFLVSAEREACQPLPLKVELSPGAKLVIDGIIIAAEGLCVTHRTEQMVDQRDNAISGCSGDASTAAIPLPSRAMLRHATLVPRSTHCCCPADTSQRSLAGRLVIGQGVGEVCLDHAITGPIEMATCGSACAQGCKGDCDEGGQCSKCPPPSTQLRVMDSVIDGNQRAVIGPEVRRTLSRPAGFPTAVAALAAGQVGTFMSLAISSVRQERTAGIHLQASRSTLIGRIDVQTLGQMDGCICTEEVRVERTQSGLIRFSNAPGDPKRQPSRLRCQPDESARRLQETDFESLSYGEPGFCQLRRTAPVEVRRGADDGGEMGVFHDQFAPHRELALERRLAEFTPATHTLSVMYIEEQRATSPVEDK